MLRLATPQDRAAPGTAGPARDAYARGGRLVFYVAVAQSVLFGLSSLFNGFYEFAVWGPLTLALLAVVTFVVLVGPLRLSRPGQVALGALGVLLLWAALSANWSESLDRTWTEVNRLLFYFVVLLITVAGVRAVREARIVMGVLTTAFVAVSGVRDRSLPGRRGPRPIHRVPARRADGLRERAGQLLPDGVLGLHRGRGIRAGSRYGAAPGLGLATLPAS